VGERAANCHRAITALAACEGCVLDGRSPLYETEPVGLEDQPWFVNAVVRIRTGLRPEALLTRLKALERALGRRPGGPRSGPRVLDLDILFYDDMTLETPDLQIPHPRLHERRFVLQPLCALAPDLVHPVLGKSARSLLQALGDGKKVIPLS
jgi:2-amino-4-hydroxy-6-hydroxymethyldihydropteridine diphosphokinase